MKTLDLFTSAVSNTFRSKTRTILTILAIFVGAFTLTITNGLGTGINQYIDDTVTSMSAEDVMTVSITPDADSGFRTATSGPTEYDPDAVSGGGFGPNEGGNDVAITPDDLDTIANVDGVLSVEATKSISPDWIQYGDGTQYVTSVGGLVAGQSVQLAAGEVPDASSDAFELNLPVSYLEPLGFADADAAVGETITFAITDAKRTQHLVEASIRFDPNATDAEVTVLKDNRADAGFTGTTVADQLGTVKTIIDAIVLVLNAFAIIALLAGTAISSVLSGAVLADLPGLTLIAFDPLSITVIILVVMAVAFLTGTLPAARAAKADPVESLRYE